MSKKSQKMVEALVSDKWNKAIVQSIFARLETDIAQLEAEGWREVARDESTEGSYRTLTVTLENE